MAKILKKTKILLKNLDNKDKFIEVACEVIDLMKRDIKILQSNSFLQALNQNTKELFLRDVNKKDSTELNEINEELKIKYEELNKMLGIKDKGKGFSKKASNIMEIYTIFTIKDNNGVYLEQESIGRTVRELREEIRLIESINKELGYKKNRNKVEKKVEKKSEVKEEKIDTDLSWSRK